MSDANTGGADRIECNESLTKYQCRRKKGHDGAHQASAFENDGNFDMQIIEWWSIKPNGDPVEGDSDE